ncbi:WD40/YVTN/BNR-like repeat-containing protein [Aureibacter tunicatorum]|uniref:Photosystem II stability/assembly factor-like uncharacterized protein n=1 Tax=Aureibacter tunicatorum TaxID=866807 RepID=A0AAE4BUM0_9BACT|nr:YCF48-related protein [Aureibacter tunicatorum]MDR6240927.1 photosystem II stability/assembly factor-like uncharacterized protein [Aureibacter tunicatorum]BDD03707.1 hypothetical protein AUTU_11900 [Aureibacter tunicatorum]
MRKIFIYITFIALFSCKKEEVFISPQWVDISTSLLDSLNSTYAFSYSDIYYLDENSLVLVQNIYNVVGARIQKSVDAGSTWKDVYSVDFANNFTMTTYDSKYVWFFTDRLQGEFPAVIYSYDGGLNWTENLTNNGFDRNFAPKKAYFVTNEIGWVVGADSLNSSYPEIYKTVDGGINWRKQFNFDPQEKPGYFTDIQFIDQNEGIASSSQGIWKSTNGGNTWTRIFNEINNADYTSVFILDENTYYIGGNKPVNNEPFIYKSSNAGSSWTEQNIPSTTNNDFSDFISINFQNESEGYALMRGYFLNTTNGGNNWNINFTIDQDIRGYFNDVDYYDLNEYTERLVCGFSNYRLFYYGNRKTENNTDSIVNRSNDGL